MPAEANLLFLGPCPYGTVCYKREERIVNTVPYGEPSKRSSWHTASCARRCLRVKR